MLKVKKKKEERDLSFPFLQVIILSTFGRDATAAVQKSVSSLSKLMARSAKPALPLTSD